MRRYRLLRVLKIGLFVVFAVTVFSFLGMTLRNVLMPGIFAVRTISFWQALGLLVLCKILFGGLRPSAEVRRPAVASAHNGTLGTNDTGGAREIQARNASRLRSRPNRRNANQRSRGGGMSSIHFINTELARPSPEAYGSA